MVSVAKSFEDQWKIKGFVGHFVFGVGEEVGKWERRELGWEGGDWDGKENVGFGVGKGLGKGWIWGQEGEELLKGWIEKIVIYKA
jgi:hypothetical protein